MPSPSFLRPSELCWELSGANAAACRRPHVSVFAEPLWATHVLVCVCLQVCWAFRRALMQPASTSALLGHDQVGGMCASRIVTHVEAPTVSDMSTMLSAIPCTG